MKLNLMSELNEEEFRRLIGIKRQIFKRMIEILSSAETKKKKLGGKIHSVWRIVNFRHFHTYWREYRTFFQHHLMASPFLSDALRQLSASYEFWP